MLPIMAQAQETASSFIKKAIEETKGNAIKYKDGKNGKILNDFTTASGEKKVGSFKDEKYFLIKNTTADYAYLDFGMSGNTEDVCADKFLRYEIKWEDFDSIVGIHTNTTTEESTVQFLILNFIEDQKAEGFSRSCGTNDFFNPYGKSTNVKNIVIPYLNKKDNKIKLLYAISCRSVEHRICKEFDYISEKGKNEVLFKNGAKRTITPQFFFNSNAGFGLASSTYLNIASDLSSFKFPMMYTINENSNCANEIYEFSNIDWTKMKNVEDFEEVKENSPIKMLKITFENNTIKFDKNKWNDCKNNQSTNLSYVVFPYENKEGIKDDLIKTINTYKNLLTRFKEFKP